MKKIYFKEFLTSSILNKEKTTTWRIWDKERLKKENIKEGDIVTFFVADADIEFTKAKIISIKNTKFKHLTKEDKEIYANDEEMYELFSKFYNIPINEETNLIIFSFELVD